MIKNLTVISENQAVSILRLNFTWRYWIWGLTRFPEYTIDTDSIEPHGVSKQDNEKLKSKFLLMLEGVEVFMYNRAFAYDAISELLRKEDDSLSSSSSSTREKTNVRYRHRSKEHDEASLSNSSDSDDRESGKTVSRSGKTLNFLLKVLPVGVTMKRAVVVMGNVTTPSIMIASCLSANGIIDVTKPANPLDIYQSLHLFELEKFQISSKPNLAYDGARYSQTPSNPFVAPKKHNNVSKLDRFQKSLHSIASIFSRRKNQSVTDDRHAQWAGLRRYRGGDKLDEYNILENLHSDEEYAKYSLILDTVSAKIGYHYDIPGLHPAGDTSKMPEYGADIELSSATIHYGAWTDKQRVPLQSMFFPPVARDSEPTAPVKTGQLRRYSGFKVNVTTNDEIILRVPTREPSKDKEVLRGQTNNISHQTEATLVRPFGWLELKVAANSTITMFSSFDCSEIGWENKLTACFANPEVRSSVNHDIFFSADNHYLDCDIGFPRAWNGKCTWTFDNVSTNARMFFLREHTLLISDIFADFGSGAPTPYEQFRPFTYIFKWQMENYKIYLNVNDSNIINNPLDFTSNRYVSVQGEDLSVAVTIPLLGQFTTVTTVDFNVFTPAFKLNLDTPPWHTGSAFMGPTYTIGQSKNFSVEGSYTYYDAIEVNSSNGIVIRCIGDDITLKFYGFVMKYIFVIRENYMGDSFHFKTFEEYNDSMQHQSSADSSTINQNSNSDYNYWNVIKAENSIDCLFSFQVRNALLVLPENIYSCKSHIGLLFDYFDLDIRFTNYFMDMQADFSPVNGVHVINDENCDVTLFDIPLYKKTHSTTDIFVDGLCIHGHRMFGVPPHEITYYCNWRIATDAIKVDSNPSFLNGLSHIVPRFLFSFNDLANALEVTMPTVYDALSFTFECPLIDIRVRCTDNDPTLIKVTLKDLLMNYNDIANFRYSTKLSLLIPLVKVVMENEVEQKIYAHVETKVNLENFTRKKNYKEHRKLQQEHNKLNDAPFHRCPFLLSEEMKDDVYEDAYGCFIVPTSLLNVHTPLNIYTSSDFTFEGSPELEDDTNSFDEAKIDGLFMPPTQNYNEEEMAPDSEKDTRFKYDDFVVTLDAVSVHLTPKAIEYKSLFDEKFDEVTLDNIMDEIEQKTLAGLKKLMLEVSMDDKFRIVSPQINLQFAEYYGSTIEQMTSEFEKIPRVNISIFEPSIASSEAVERYKKGEQYFEHKYTSGAISLKRVNFMVTGAPELKRPITLDLSEIELWFSEDQDESVVSLNLENAIVDIQRDQVCWFIQYAAKLWNQNHSFLQKSISIAQNKKNKIPHFVYRLATATDEHKVDHDPGVITKPAYILRSLKEHVRSFDSWLVVTRFRHLYTNMPPEWNRNVLEENPSKIPDDAFNEVLDRFCQWRSWEANFAQREQFFSELFNFKALSQKKQVAQIILKNVGLLLQNGDASDSIQISGLSISSMVRSTEAKFSSANHELEDDFDANIRSSEVLVNLEHFKGKISNVLIDLVPHIINVSKDLFVVQEGVKSIENNEGVALEKTKKSANRAFVFTVNVRRFDQVLECDDLGVNLGVVDLVSSSVVQQIENECLLSTTSRFTDISFGILDKGNRFLSYSIERSILTFSNMSGSNYHFLDVLVDNCTFSIKNQKLFETVQKGKVIYEKLNKSLDLGEPQPKSTKSVTKKFDPWDFLNSTTATLNIQINHFSWSLDILKPLKLKGAVYDNNFSLILADGVADIGSLIQKTDMVVSMQNHSHIEAEGTQLFNNFKITRKENFLMVMVDMHLGFSKVTFLNIIDFVNSLLDFKEDWTKELERFKSLVPEPKQPSKVTEETSDNPQLAVDFKMASDYFGVSFVSERTKYALAIEEFESNVSNISLDKEIAIVKYHGSVLSPVIRCSVLDRSVSIGLSNVIDFHLNVKLMNDTKNKNGYLLEVQSHHCRICLSTSVVKCLVNMIDQVTSLSDRLLNHAAEPNPPKPDTASDDSTKKGLPFTITSTHVLAYNFCIGWIFENARKDYPGLIFGSERFYAVTDERLGKLSLMETYLAVAHGSKASTFFSSSSEKNNPNRAFLPLMQYVYTIKDVGDSKDMRINIVGDELDVNFLPDSLLVADYVVKAFSEIQDFLNKRSTARPTPKPESSNEEIDYIQSFRSNFSFIECRANFAGSNVLIHRLEDDRVNPGNSLFLHFPAVKTVTFYEYNHEDEIKHIIRCEILTTSSDNTLHSTCVPVVQEIADSMKYMMRGSNATKPKQALETKEPTNNFNFGHVLKDMEIHVGLKIERQRLALSCEPTAKVETVVEIESIFMQMNSVHRHVPTIVLDAKVGTLSASLQHIYSREVSGSFAIPSVIFTTSVELSDPINVLCAGSLSDLNAYVDVKQYQDLDLFKDIWFPKKAKSQTRASEDSSTQPALSDNKSIAMRFKEVSTTTAVPWILTFIFMNVSLKVHFGPSLGNAFLKLDQLSIVSKKTSDWSQRLKLAINSIILTCEGRLSGGIVANDIFLHSGINWKMDDGTTLDVPLILVSAGIEKLQLKISFDYHLIAVSNFSNFSVDIYNKKSDKVISKDHLFAGVKFDIFEVFVSSFTAANTLDIFHAVLRMIQENQVSYKETLRDSNKEAASKSNFEFFNHNEILETVKILETEFEVIAGMLLIHVYPSSFADSKVLVVKLDESRATFSQNEFHRGISNQLDVQFNDLTVSLSTSSQISEDFIQGCTVDEFIDYAHKARGGNMFVFPSFQISMKTFQGYHSNLIEYLYQSTFGGAVDVRWNLGTVNFIREMYGIHSDSLASRMQTRKNLRTSSGEIEFREDMFTKPPPQSRDLDADLDPTTQIDQAINNTIDKVSRGSKYSYLPLAPPIIEAPQLKELGNATPPLEWFGLHRNKFPNVTHELAIVSLQRIIHEVEREYSRILGRA